MWIENCEQAQKLMNRPLQTNWAELLNGFAGGLNPVRESIFERYPASYYWTCCQSEWAADRVFAIRATSVRQSYVETSTCHPEWMDIRSAGTPGVVARNR